MRLAGATLLASSMTGLAALVPAVPAHAATPTTWSDAVFVTYGTGSEVHLKALDVGSTSVAGLEQAFSGQAVASPKAGGLTQPICATTGAVVQPNTIPSSVNAYARATGAEVGLATSNSCTTDPNQLKLPVFAESKSPPLSSPVSKSLLDVPLSTLAHADALTVNTSAAFDPNVCPIGQPLAYGESHAAAVDLLKGQPISVSTTGSNGTAGVAQSKTYSYLLANPDGTFGIASKTSEIIAPVSVNLVNTQTTKVSLDVSVQGTSPNEPVSLLAHSDGKKSTVTLSNDDPTIAVDLTINGTKRHIATVSLQQVFGMGGFVLDLSKPTTWLNQGGLVGNITDLLNALGLKPVSNQLLDVLSQLFTQLGLKGKIAIGAPLYQLPNLPTVHPNGTTAAAAGFDLVQVTLSVGTLGVTDLRIGHMEVGSLLKDAFTCTIPVNKTANPMTVQAGNQFTWNISIPTDAHSLDVQKCDLIAVSAVDHVGVFKGSPKFQIVSVSNGGVYNQSTQTITWANLGNYHPGDPPIALTITVNVPADSPGGILQDIVNVSSGIGKCTGGATNDANLNGNLSNTKLTGSFTLNAPTVVPNAPLPHTGGGTLLAWLGGGLLILAEGGRRLLRRARRSDTTIG
jgi:hypothetical protein